MTDQTRTDEISPQVWRIASVIVFGAFMAGLDSSLVNVALETITHKLNGSLAAAQWVSSGYLVALAAALPICGWLGKRIGPGRLWMIALAGFTFASLLCAIAPNIEILVLCRVFQGVTGGLLVPSGQAVLGRAAGPRHMGTVMNTAGVAVVLAPAIGPTIGGLLLNALSWRWLFLVNLPIGAAALALGAKVLPRQEDLKDEKLDVFGLVLLSFCMPALTFGIVQVSRREVGQLAPWALIVLGALSLGSYIAYAIRRAGRLPVILDLRLFGIRAYSVAQSAIFFCGASLYAGLILLPLYFQMLRHESVVNTGLLLLAYGAGSAISLRVSGKMTDRFGGGLTGSLGLVITILSTVPFAIFKAGTNIVLVEALQFVRGVGISFAGLPVISTAYALVKHDELPDATVQANMLQRLGGSIGSALIIVLLDSYKSKDVSAFQHIFLWLSAPAGIALLSTLLLSREQKRC